MRGDKVKIQEIEAAVNSVLEQPDYSLEQITEYINGN